MAPGQPAYRFKIYRPPFDESRQAALSKDIMSTQRLQAIADGETMARGASAKTNYVSHGGRQVSPPPPPTPTSRPRPHPHPHLTPTPPPMPVQLSPHAPL